MIPTTTTTTTTQVLIAIKVDKAKKANQMRVAGQYAEAAEMYVLHRPLSGRPTAPTAAAPPPHSRLTIHHARLTTPRTTPLSTARLQVQLNRPR